MNDIVTGKSEFGRELAEALGLEHCTHLAFSIGVDEAAVVEARFFMTVDQAEEVVEVFKKYYLKEKIA